jgi:hypothetical protein
LDGWPRVFEGSLFLLEDFDGRTSPAELSFDHMAFWVRMVNLPLECMGRETGNLIGASVGEVEVVNTDGRGVRWGNPYG